MAVAGGQSRVWRAGLRWLRRTPLYPVLALLWAHRVVVRRSASGFDSMYPLFQRGDVVLFDRLALWLEPPRRGDVVLVEAPWLPEPRLVKLVVGLPGERVAVAGDRLWIDGRLLRFPQPIVGAAPGRWELGVDEFFVLSYAVAVGTDSRHFGPLPRRALVARAWRQLEPPERRRVLHPLLLALEESPADPLG